MVHRVVSPYYRRLPPPIPNRLPPYLPELRDQLTNLHVVFSNEKVETSNAASKAVDNGSGRGVRGTDIRTRRYRNMGGFATIVLAVSWIILPYWGNTRLLILPQTITDLCITTTNKVAWLLDLRFFHLPNLEGLEIGYPGYVDPDEEFNLLEPHTGNFKNSQLCPQSYGHYMVLKNCGLYYTAETRLLARLLRCAVSFHR